VKPDLALSSCPALVPDKPGHDDGESIRPLADMANDPGKQFLKKTGRLRSIKLSRL
jgi:hypothetical protein